MSELAPCPFCGGPADLAVGVHCGPADLGARTWWAKCVTCGVETTSSRERLAAVAAWNRRARPDRPRTRIAAAAVRFRIDKSVGAVKAGDWLTLSMPPPARHHHILHAMAAAGLAPVGLEHEHAFILSDGTWADRKRALEIATDAGQLVQHPSAARSPIAPPNLFSEDLW